MRVRETKRILILSVRCVGAFVSGSSACVSILTHTELVHLTFAKHSWYLIKPNLCGVLDGCGMLYQNNFGHTAVFKIYVSIIN